jgi:hypothetical protein
MVIFRGCAVRPWSVVTRTRRRFSSYAFACVGYNCSLQSRKMLISACGSRLLPGRFPARGRVLHAPSPAVVSCRCLLSGFLFVFVSVCVDVCLYIPACNHSLPVGSCFKSGFPGFVGRDSSSLLTPTAFRPFFSPLGVRFVIGALIVMFSSLVCTPFGELFFWFEWKKKTTLFKKKCSRNFPWSCRLAAISSPETQAPLHQSIKANLCCHFFTQKSRACFYIFLS